MKNLKSLAMAFGVGLLLVSLSIKADEWDKKTIITFSGPVQVADTQLPAGTYVFKLADSMSDRHIVQIFNEDQSHIIATILATPDYRVEPADNTVIKFAETADGSEASGTLPASGIPIKEWFYPGDNTGNEFRVASNSPVAAVQQDAVVPSAAVSETTTSSSDAAAATEPDSEAQPSEEGPSAQEQAAPAPQTQPDTTAQPQSTAPATDQESTPDQKSTTPDSQLPQTASNVPLVGLIGVLSLAAAATLRIFLKVSA